MSLRALIADDHSLYRTGLALLLRDKLAISGVLEASTFDAALDRLADTPDIGLALFDLSMPGMGGPESLTVIKDTYPNIRVAVVSGIEDRDTILKAIEVGVNGYIPKSLPENDMVKALELVLAGHVYVPTFMALAKQDAVSAYQSAPHAARITGFDRLTPRQRDVLACILRGRSNKEIARDLRIAEGTVKIHLAALFVHFSARNRTELATRAQASRH